MKKWVTYLILVLYISTSTQLSQLYKLPVFISHFIEHSKDGNFFDEMKFFIVHHYGGHEMDEDWETDQKLPFMKIEIAHIDLSVLPKISFQIPFITKEIIQTKTHFYRESQLHSHYLNSIWQPPKQA